MAHLVGKVDEYSVNANSKYKGSGAERSILRRRAANVVAMGE